MSNTSMRVGSNGPDIGQPVLNVLILYDHGATFTNMVREHLDSFSLYSPHRTFYAAATISNLDPPSQVDLTPFDVLIVHYSVRLCFNHLLPVYAKAVEHFSGLKILFIQDEYDNTELERQWITRLGIDVVFTCVPQPYINQVYPQGRFPSVKFINVLTGYVPLQFEAFTPRPLSQRKYVIGYRGRPPLFRYGDLAREKWVIGRRMREVCEARGLLVSIEWENEKRIYGHAWYEFLQDCRATLGTESGSNVFDADGRIQRAVDRALLKDPAAPYETIRAKYLAQHEGRIRMNQISPRIFEAIACKTALVLFEGEYSGIISPDVHYIPLKKDFSNVDDVLCKLANDKYLEELIRRAYGDFIESRCYSYQTFVEMVLQIISRRVCAAKDAAFMSSAFGRYSLPVKKRYQAPSIRLSRLPSRITSEPLSPNTINPPWNLRHFARLLCDRNFQTARAYVGNTLLRNPAAHRMANMIIQGLQKFQQWHGSAL
jgi:hypothetical protein